MDICFISLFIFLVNVFITLTINAKEVEINSEADFRASLLSSSDNIILNIKNEIIFNEADSLVINESLEWIKINGVSQASSKLILNSNSLIFESTIKEIEISNITIDSPILFNNNVKITFQNVIINGYLKMDMSNSHNNSINILNSIFKTSKRKSIDYFIDGIQTNIYIDQSQFYGDENLLRGCLNIDNMKNSEVFGTVTINNSLISGGYKRLGLNAKYIKEINILNSEVKECYNEIVY